MAKRRRKARRTYRRNKGGKSWKALVKRYGVKKAAKMYRKRKGKGKRRPFRGRRRNSRKSRRYRRSRR